MGTDSGKVTRRSFIGSTGTFATGLTLLSGSTVTGSNYRGTVGDDRCAFIYKTPSGTLKDNAVGRRDTPRVIPVSLPTQPAVVVVAPPDFVMVKCGIC